MKNGICVSKKYMTNGMFKINVMTIAPMTNSNNIDFSTYVIEFFYICCRRKILEKNKADSRIQS